MDCNKDEQYVVLPSHIYTMVDLSLAERMTLFRLVSFQNATYFESPENTAEVIGVGVDVVKHARAKFVKMGFIEKVDFKNNRTVYRVNAETILEHCQGAKRIANNAKVAQKEVSSDQGRSELRPKVQNDTYIYINKEDEYNITPLNPPTGGCVAQKDKNDEKDEVDNIFNLWLSCFGLSGRKLTPGRQAKIKRRLKDCGKDQLELAIRNTSQDYFYRGDNDRGWQADIDYICRSAEIVERLANMTPRGERPMTWWEEKQQRELEQCAPRYGCSERGGVPAENDDYRLIDPVDGSEYPFPVEHQSGLAGQADKPATDKTTDDATAPLDIDWMRKRFLEGKARARARNEASRSSDKARAKVGL